MQVISLVGKPGKPGTDGTYSHLTFPIRKAFRLSPCFVPMFFLNPQLQAGDDERRFFRVA